MINENDIIKWNGMEINRKLQNTKVFDDFISIFGVKHFSERLTKIDIEVGAGGWVNSVQSRFERCSVIATKILLKLDKE